MVWRSEDFARAPAFIVDGDGARPGSWCRLGPPDQEIRNGSNFAPYEVFCGPIGSGGSYRAFNLCPELRGHGAVVFPTRCDCGRER